ncbi:50S ribosomal protein L25 [Candidatus Shapirobacteria bacterium]|nr:50S ribosomal protein L25 [Candidatus Shapirobacteria bacterium]
MEKRKLKVEKRKILGRQVRKLRREGVIPANIYGKAIKSLAVAVKEKELRDVYKEVGETGVIELEVEGEKENKPVLIHNLQVHPVSGQSLHVDFHQVVLTEKTTVTIPVELTGESPAVAQKLGILVQPISEIEVEALPGDLPEKFTVDISGLANVGDAVLVKDIPADRKKLALKAGEDQVVAKVEPLAKEEVVTPPPAATGVASAAEGAEAAPAEKGEAAPSESEGEAAPPEAEAKEEAAKEEPPAT